ncbi:MAG: hypothetical protein Q9204_007957 [Flavoplaca sp. TL-2023a]
MDQSIKRVITFHFERIEDDSYVVLLKAAWALVLSWASRATDVTLGHLVSGRFAALEGIHEVVGPCLNVIPAWIIIDTTFSLGDLLRHVQEQQIAATPYESVPFDRIAKQAKWPSLTRFPAIFQYQSLPEQSLLKHESDIRSPSWTYAGNAVYGGGLLQDGACWLMAFPENKGRASLRLTFAKETLSTAAAECTLDVFCQFLCAINSSNQQNKLASLLPSPPDKNFLDVFYNTTLEQKPWIPQHDASSPSPSITASLATVAERIEPLWT